MSISEPFIRRPIGTALLTIGLAFFGLLAYLQLPVSDLPSVDFPTIQVSASLPGASPETMATAVALPLEKQFSTIASVDSMSSSSTEGATQITLQFALDRNIDAAAQDVQTAIARTARQLPQDMPSAPSFRKVNPADSSVMHLGLSSSTLPVSKVDEIAENVLAQRISTLPGAAQVQVFGQQKYAVRVQLDPNRLATLGIGLDEVSEAIQNGNVNVPTGSLSGAQRSYSVEASGRLENAAQYRPLVVAYRNGAPVRLDSIARVYDGVENDKSAAWIGKNLEPGILLAVYRQPGSNAVALVNAVREVLPSLRAQLPPGLNLRILYDRSQTIQASVHDVKLTLLLSLVLVVIVIYAFLRSARAAFIPSIAIPLSLAGTFAAMYLLDFSLNNISLMALTLCVGFVVDDAIVMLENISRHVEDGKSPMEAALIGSREIGFTILSMTVSLAAVFIPVLFMSGIVGRLFHEFAVTIVVAILVSGVVSLTLTPMLGSRMLKARGPGTHPAATDGRLFTRVKNFYERTLRVALQRRRAVLITFALLLVATAVLYTFVPKGFMSGDDTGFLNGTTEAAPDISFAAMAEKQKAAMRAVATQPGVADLVGIVGGEAGGGRGLNSGRIMIPLVPQSERPSAEKLVAQLRSKVSGISGLNVFVQNQPALRIGGMATKSQYQYSLLDADADELMAWVPKILEGMSKLPGFEDVTTDLTLNSPKVRVEIDRDRAAALGLNASQIENALYTAYGDRQVSTILAPNDQYAVILELQPEYQVDPSALGLLYVRSSSGTLVPLNAVARLRTVTGPLTIQHVGQLPSATISFNLKQDTSLGEAVKAIEKLQIGLKVPDALLGRFQGTAQAFQSSIGGMGILLLLAVVAIYLVLGVLYESAIHPITILSGLPSAGLGALITLLIFGVQLDLFAFLGLVMLIGIVKKNAIMMIDFALEAQRNHGRTPAEAIFEACVLRFRPIMMTTVAALVATLPIALGFGAGGESRRPLGLAVIGGLIVSQLLTLYITPVIYVGLDGLAHRYGRRKRVSVERVEATGAPAQ